MKEDKLFENIHNRVMKSLDDIVFEELHSQDVKLDYEDFYIEIYRHDGKRTDCSYITKNKKRIYDFLTTSYKNKNIEYTEFECPDDLLGLDMKIACVKDSDEIIAMSVYKKFLDKQLCVGICSTTDENYKTIGKKAVNEIIKYDVNKGKPFYWCELNDTIGNLYDKFDGVKVPAIYASEIRTDENPGKDIKLCKDGYFYTVYLESAEQNNHRLIYAFDSPVRFNKAVEKETDFFKQEVAEIKNKYNIESLTEEEYINAKIDIIEDISNRIFFYRVEQFGEQDNPPYILNILKESVDYLKYLLDNDIHTEKYSTDDIFDIWEAEKDRLEIHRPYTLCYIE